MSFALLSPKGPVVAGSETVAIIRYTHEGAVLGPGAALRLGFNGCDAADCPQIDDPAASGFASASTDASARIAVANAASRRSITFFPRARMSNLMVVDVRVESGEVRAGEHIDVHLGSAEAGWVPGRIASSPLEFFGHVDADGRFPLLRLHPRADQYWQYIAEAGADYPDWQPCGVAIALTHDIAATADLSLPAVLEAGAVVMLRLVVYDRFHNHLGGMAGSVELRGDAAGFRLQTDTFDTGADGFCLLPLRVPRRAFAGTLRFQVGSLGLFGTNPVSTSTTRGTKVLWGDLHGHSRLSDGGCRGPDSFFRYARDIRGLDFAGLADHTFGLAVKGHWTELLDSVRHFDRPRGFVTLLGYELLPDGGGHRNIYFPGDDGLLLMGDYQCGSGGSFPGENLPAYGRIWDSAVPRAETREAIWTLLGGREHLYTAHHCWDVKESERERITLYEACSEWGLSDGDFRRNLSTTTLQEVFASGMAPGLFGGSDDHGAKAGFMGDGVFYGPIRYPSGLTAVFCESLDRQSIYRALCRKHCYATTGARILLRPAARRAGSVLEVEADIEGQDLLDRCFVFKNGVLVHEEWAGAGTRWTLRWRDPVFGPGDNCFVRFTQKDGQTAWLNPLPFIDESS